MMWFREEEIEKRMFAVFEAAKKRQAKGDQRGEFDGTLGISVMCWPD